MKASACAARTYRFVELIFSRCVWLFVPVWVGAFSGRHVPALPLRLGILGDVEPESFVMHAHGLNSFVLYFCSPCGAGRDPAPHLWPSPHHCHPPQACSGPSAPQQFIDPRCLFSGLLQRRITKEQCFRAVHV